MGAEKTNRVAILEMEHGTERTAQRLHPFEPCPVEIRQHKSAEQRVADTQAVELDADGKRGQNSQCECQHRAKE